MNNKSKKNIAQIIDLEGLDYALIEYASIFHDAKDPQLSELVNKYNLVCRQIKSYLESQGVLNND